MENNLSNPPFYIGQEVVALKTHSSGCPKKEGKYIIEGVYKYPCCNVWVVDYGEKINHKEPHDECHKCGKLYNPSISPSNNYLIGPEWFAHVSRLRVSSELTIAEDLFQTKPVEERADVLIPETIKN